MGRRKVEVRREEILDATVAQVQQRGFGGTRVADVAHALGISSGLVFYHFGTKDVLFAAALEHAADSDLARLERIVARAKSPVDALRRVLALYSPQGSAPGWTIWVDAWAQALYSEEMREASRRLDVRWKDVLAAVIADGVAANCWRCEDPDAAAWRLSSQVDGLAVQVLVHRNLTRKQLAEWVRTAAARELQVSPESLA